MLAQLNLSALSTINLVDPLESFLNIIVFAQLLASI